ncbi:ADPATP carrier protein [Nucleospora cyclopteri]
MGSRASLILEKFSNLMSIFKTDKQISLTILGLDAAGKTTLVNLLKNSTGQTVPTLGFNSEDIVIGQTNIRLWDVGGQTSIMNFWGEYVKSTDGLVFMIDIADEARFKKAYDAFSVLTGYMRENIPILFLFNKTDLINSSEIKTKRVAQLKSLFNCDDVTGMAVEGKHYRSKVIECSVKNEQDNLLTDMSYSMASSNIYSGFKWVMKVAEGKEYS